MVFRNQHDLYLSLSQQFSGFKQYSAEQVYQALTDLNWIYETQFGLYVYPGKKRCRLFRMSVTQAGSGFASEITEEEAQRNDFFKKEKKDTDIFFHPGTVDSLHLLDGDIFYSDIVQYGADQLDNVFIFKKMSENQVVCDIRKNTQTFAPTNFLAYVPALNHINLINVIASKKIEEEYDKKPGFLGIIKQVRELSFKPQGGFKVVKNNFVLERFFNSESEIENTINSILAKFNLESTFPDIVVEQARSFGDHVPEYDRQVRKDLTHLNFVTIDGEDARDFDDAVYCEPLNDGSGWKLYVAIADVSYYVREDTALNTNACKRATSIYFPTKVVPMLPEELSNGLCSINPHVKRFTLCCEMIIDRKGKLKTYDFYQACIISKNRFTYNQVQDIIDSKYTDLRYSTPELNNDIRNLNCLYQALLKARDKRGALVIETSEPKFKFNPDGSIAEIYFLERKDAHKLIEELMIITNVAAAKFVDDHAALAPNRNHAQPPLERVVALNQSLYKYGYEISPYPDSHEYNELLEKINNLTEDRDLLNSLVLRSLPRALYEVNSTGHFGLALDKYAQFTSPIRRYPDLLLHRVIKSIIFAKNEQAIQEQGGYVYDYDRMDKLCFDCSSTEYKVEKASYDFLDWIKCRFMERFLGKDFIGVISTVAKNGVFVRIPEYQIDGFLSFNSSTPNRALAKLKETAEIRQRLHITVHRISLHDRKLEFILASDKRKPVTELEHKFYYPGQLGHEYYSNKANRKAESNNYWDKYGNKGKSYKRNKRKKFKG
ncbi:ribonuclease R family protein [Psittacicella hinzii]|nr:VacB/RNase II family 3'-5' exoribonuclease [Psittacicella hinzii]